MKATTKISIQAKKIADAYVSLIIENKTPVMLAAWVNRSKYDLMNAINDKRLNMSDTLEKIRIEARFEINQQLNNNLTLKNRLIRLRSI